VFHHLIDAWNRKDEANILLVHYADLLDDLAAEMRRVATFLKIDVSANQIDELAPAASFRAMRANGENLAPDPAGALKDKSRFFRAGRSGGGSSILDAEALSAYESRAAQAAPPELLAWLHR